MEIHLPVGINQGYVVKLALLTPGVFHFKVEPFNANLKTLLDRQVPLPPVLGYFNSCDSPCTCMSYCRRPEDTLRVTEWFLLFRYIPLDSCSSGSACQRLPK